MSTADPGPVPAPESTLGPAVPGETVPTTAAPRTGAVWPVSFGVAVALALGAAIGAWVVGETFLEYYAPSHEAASHPYAFARLRAEKSVADSRNTAIAYGALGGLLGLALGIAGGLARGSLMTGLLGAAAGTALGAGAGAGLSFAMVPYYLRSVDPTEPSLMLPLVSHGAIWTVIGLAGGLAFGLGTGSGSRTLRAAFGGTVGALLGTIAFEMVQALWFPLLPVDDFIGPTPLLRVTAVLCVAAFTALGAVGQELVSARRRTVKAG